MVAARDAEEAGKLFRDDLWTRHGVLVESEIIEWSVFLDSRRKAS